MLRQNDKNFSKSNYKKVTQQGDIPVRIINENKFVFS